ncbi:hypothetical protein Q4E93_25795 [Flavitalea sp. BT771]|uniref:hypothetical protein n=1 Tax=Flavitalea sp. BT771 TaxID=3063329 RepID=UPI0026E18857|nr:hypothetical protein [Flavitalea sp. BT771]MDO6434048.1 hypothetical protein [Flavitalea sp. BT771]MDV6222948.1 hypothetical protein [Flavitalea sp. BT771]
MQSKKEILEELEGLSMKVAGISRQMPFEVPEGYFPGFPEKMLGLLAEDTADAALSPGWGKGPAFSVPSGYFEGFASRMMDRIKTELGEQPLDVTNEVSQEVSAELAAISPFLSQIAKKTPFQVPVGYFETLEAAPVLPEETLSPLMAGLKNQPTYQAPEGYFETFPEILSARVQPAAAAPARTARVISMNSRRKVWWQYSAAAVIIGFVFSIGWLRLHTSVNKPGLTGTDVSQGLAKVSDQDIESYLDNQDNHVAQLQQDDAIGKSIASLEFSDNDIKSFLGDLSDNELTQYMEEHGDLKDYPTN